AQRAGDYRAALAAYREAAAIDDRDADLAFVTAQCAAALDERDEAERQWRRARDLDSLRFRADSRINQIVRAVAAEGGGRDVALVDLEGAIAADASSGTEPFVDHVHLDVRGNVIAARAMFEALRTRLTGVRFLPLPDDPAA